MKQVVVIHIDEDEGVVRSSLAGMEHPDNVLEILTAFHDQAAKLLNLRANQRRFRRPVSFSVVSDGGDSESSWLVAEDARGQKARVRLEISR
jgi:hypothetical protein